VEFLSVARQLLLVAHLIGLAAVIGPFLLQLRLKSGFDFRVMLSGAIVQVVTGLLLVGVAQARHVDVDNAKIAVKLAIGVLVLAAVIVARVKQRQAVAAGSAERASLPWLHIAGAGAIANVLVAVLWR